MNEFLERWLFLGMNKEQAKGASKVIWRLTIAVGGLAAYGFFSWAGVPGFANAADVDAKISAVTQQVLVKLAEQETRTNKTNTKVDSLLASLLERDIRAQYAKRCDRKNSPDDREQAQREIDRLQSQHKESAGERYSFSCADL